MKVTDEMVERAWVYCKDDGGNVREMLEAALRDVPEPAEDFITREEVVDAWDRWRARAKAAEGQLAKVRAWRKAQTDRQRPGPDWDRLDTILDES